MSFKIIKVSKIVQLIKIIILATQFIMISHHINILKIKIKILLIAVYLKQAFNHKVK